MTPDPQALRRRLAETEARLLAHREAGAHAHDAAAALLERQCAGLLEMLREQEAGAPTPEALPPQPAGKPLRSVDDLRRERNGRQQDEYADGALSPL
jgi:hypothetical protein